MAKSRERLDAEAAHSMTTAQKLSNFWFYYKWWLLGGAFALLMAAMFFRDMRANVKPDYTIGVLTPQGVWEKKLKSLEADILPYIDDRNGDGKVTVYLAPYTITVDGNEPADPMMQAASMTRLSGDIQMGESILILTNAVEEYQKALNIFCYNDGSLPAQEADIDYTKMGVPFDEFLLVKRAVPPEQIARQKDLAAYYADCSRLFDTLTNK